MDDIFGILIFLGFAIVAVVRKVYEQRDAVRRRGESHEIDPQDLPEPVRRMLFGEDDEAPVARPRQPEPIARQATPVPPPIHPTASPRRPTPVTTEPRQPRPTLRAEPARSRPQDVARNVAQDTRQVRQEVRQIRQDVRQMRQDVPRSIAQDMARMAPAPQRSQQQIPQHARPQRHPQQVQPQAPAPRRREAQQERRPKHPQKAPPMQVTRPTVTTGSGLFDDPGELRKAILYAEILGPPKAFRDITADPWETAGR